MVVSGVARVFMKQVTLIFLLSLQLVVGSAFADSYTVPTITNTAPQTISPDLLTSQQAALKADLAATNADSTAMLFWMTTLVGCAAGCGMYYIDVRADLAQLQTAEANAQIAEATAAACPPMAGMSAGMHATMAAFSAQIEKEMAVPGMSAESESASTAAPTPALDPASIETMLNTGFDLTTQGQAQVAAGSAGDELPATASQCAAAQTNVSQAMAALHAANVKLEADSTAVKVVGTACQGIMLAAGINDMIAAEKVGTQSAKTDGMISAVGAVGISYMTGGLKAAYNIITSNNTVNQTKLTKTAGKSSCWSAAFATAEVVFHNIDASKEQSAAKQLQQTINNEQGATGAVSTTSYTPKPKSPSRLAQFFGFIKKLWGVSERNAVAAATPPTPPWVNQCTGPFTTTSAALSCAGAKDPVIQSVLSKPDNPFGALTSYMDQHLGANTTNILSGKASMDELAQIASYRFPQKKQALLEGLSNITFGGQTLGSSYAALLSGKAMGPTLLNGSNSNSIGAAVSASKPTLGVSTLTFSGSGGQVTDSTVITGVDPNHAQAPSNNSSEDPNSKMTMTGLATRDPAAAENPNLNIFDRVTSRYQSVQDRLDPTQQALKDWGSPSAQQQSLNN